MRHESCSCENKIEPGGDQSHPDQASGYACAEYASLSRRRFVQAAGVATVAAATVPAWMPKVSLARDYRSTQRDVFIQIYLRGGADGLTLCVPHGDAGLYSKRPNLAVPSPTSGQTNRCNDLDGFFGLPPAFYATPASSLMPAYQNGHLLVVHATGVNDPNRSHFDMQRFMEVGKANDPTISTGWLGRHLATVTPMNPAAILRGVGISTNLQQTLAGAPLTLPIGNLDTYNLAGSSTTLAARRASLTTMYNATPDPLYTVARNSFSTIDLLNTINFATYVPGGGAVYPSNTFGTALKQTAALIKAQIGVEAIAIDLGGWDTHNSQGSTSGTMNNLMLSLGQGMNAFYADMMASAANPSFVLAVMSEFGRRVAENLSSGTDHGHGNCMFLMGNAVTGGRVLAQWPGLGNGQLFQNLDLGITIDYRDILAEIISERLGNPNVGAIFPGYTPTMRGVVA